MLTNLDFSQAGTAPGSPLGWTVVMVSSAEEIAAFLPDGSSKEAFESGWFDGVFHLAMPTTDRVFFGGDETSEKFETRWGPGDTVLSSTALGNEYYQLSLGSSEICDFSRKDEAGNSLETSAGILFEDFGERWWAPGSIFVAGVSARVMETNDFSSTLILNGFPVWESSVVVTDDLGEVPRLETLSGRSYTLLIRPGNNAGEVDFGTLTGKAKVAYLAGGFRPDVLSSGGSDGEFTVDDYVFAQSDDNQPANLDPMRDFTSAEFDTSVEVSLSTEADKFGPSANVAAGVRCGLELDPGDGEYAVEVSSGGGWTRVGSSFAAPGAIELPDTAKIVRIKTVTPSTSEASAALKWGSAPTL